MKDDSKIRPVAGNLRSTEGTGLRVEWWEITGSSGCWLLGRDTLRTMHIKEGLWWKPRAHKAFLGELYFNLFTTWLILCVNLTGPPGAQTFCLDSILSLSVRVFLQDIWIGRMNRADCPPWGRRAPSNQFKAWENQKADFPETERKFLLPECLWVQKARKNPGSLLKWKNVGSSCVLSMLPLRLNYIMGSPRSPAFGIDLGTYTFHNSVSHNSF